MRRLISIPKVYAIIPEKFNLNELCKTIEVMLNQGISFSNTDLNLKK